MSDEHSILANLAGSDLGMTQDGLIQRLIQVEDRIAKIQAFWEDEERYDAIVSSGRYLKLCSVTEQADSVASHLRGRMVDALHQLARMGADADDDALAEGLENDIRHSA